MDPQSQTAAIPGATVSPLPQEQSTANQAPDLAALAQGITAPGAPQAPGVQPQQEQIDPRLVLAAQILQQEQTRRTELERQIEAQEEAKLQTWFEGLEEANKPFGTWAMSAVKTVKGLQSQLAQLQAENAQLKQTFTPYLVNDRLTQLSQQHGVPREFLQQYGATDPGVAEAVARAAAALLKEQQFKARQAAQVDQAATPTMTASGTPSRDAIVQQYRGGQNGGLEAKLRALGAAGLR